MSVYWSFKANFFNRLFKSEYWISVIFYTHHNYVLNNQLKWKRFFLHKARKPNAIDVGHVLYSVF